MQAVRIKDNRQFPEEHFSDARTLTDRIANKTLEELEKEGIFVFPETVGDSEDVSLEQMILQKVNTGYCTGNIMGFLGCGNERLIIESRFCGKGDDYFFQYLLNRVMDCPNLVNLETDADNDNRLFNFLLFLFPNFLKEAVRKGLFKKYVCNKYNNANIRGSIDVARHIRQNTPFIGDVAYSQREFSYDNSLTQLIRHTIEFIKTKPFAKNLLSKVKDEVNVLITATQSYEYFDRQNIIIQNKKNTVRHAYYREYRALQRLCLLILQHQKHEIGAGSKNIYGILFDGAWLWEEYISTLIGDWFHHPKNKEGSGAQHLFHGEHGKTGRIYPDFISKNPENRIIADAKYKPARNISNKDYLQVLAYMYRFDAQAGYYIYPETDACADLLLWLNRGSTYERNVQPRDDVSVIKHGLRIPTDVGSYDDFVAGIKECEKEFLKFMDIGGSHDTEWISVSCSG